MFIFIIIFLIIIFFPIPLKFIICYSQENYYIKLFNIYLIKKKPKVNDIKEQNPENNTTPNEVNNKKKKKSSKKLLSNLITPKVIFNSLKNNKFKPFLWLSGTFDYSINDAALTAISYGLISSILPFFLRCCNLLFNIRKFSLPIKPLFKDKFIAKSEIKCIICFSLAHIIHIIFLIIKEIIREKEADPLMGNL